MIATERKNPSVIAELMGFLHEAPLKQQVVYGEKRVLSENYLQKSASLLGLRERRSSKITQTNQKKSKSKLNDFGKDKQRIQSPDSRTTFGWEYKKQLLERSKRGKVCREIWSGKRVRDLGEVPSMADLDSNQRLEQGAQVLIRSNEGWKDKHFDISSHSKTKFNKVDLRSSSVDVEFFCGDEGIKQINENVESNDSANEGSFPCSSDILQDSPTSLNCIDIDEELRRITIEAHQPSPNSVLEPDNSSISEYGDNISTDLHGLWMKLQILKSESEANQSKPEIVTSSEGDPTEMCFGPKESQEFSYLINVLNEIGSFEMWHSVEHLMSPLNFERLEKKYVKQESWNKTDRRLLFDRIKLGLSEIILRPCVDFIGCSKLSRRKMVRRDAIEEELWSVLVSERTEVNADLSVKAVGKEPWLEDVGEEVDSIVGEIEAFLFNELALELVDF